MRCERLQTQKTCQIRRRLQWNFVIDTQQKRFLTAKREMSAVEQNKSGIYQMAGAAIIYATLIL